MADTEHKSDDLGLVEMSDNVEKMLVENTRFFDLDPEQAGNLFEGDEHRRTGSEPQQYGVGNEIEQGTQARQAHGYLKYSDHQRQEKGKFQVESRIRLGQWTE